MHDAKQNTTISIVCLAEEQTNIQEQILTLIWTLNESATQSAYWIYPVQVGGDAGEDGGFGVLVALSSRAVADHTMEPPYPVH